MTLDKLKELLNRATNEGISGDSQIDINVYHQIVILPKNHDWIALVQIDLSDEEITKC